MLAVLENFYVGSITKQSTMTQVLAQICKDLNARQIVEQDQVVLKDLLAREKSGGLGIPGTRLALYHTRSAGLHDVSFSVYRLQESYPLKGMDDQPMEVESILMMLAPKEMNQQALEVVSFISGLIISHEQTVALFETGTESEIHAFISNQLNEFHHSNF